LTVLSVEYRIALKIYRKEVQMEAITININNPSLTDKVTWFLKHLEADGLEIISKEDFEDLKALRTTRTEESVSFDEYLKNENSNT
jgi:hypothetical protein